MSKSWKEERWPGYVPPVQFEEYSEKYAQFFAMRRERGIIEVRFQTDGGPYRHSWAAHNAWNRVWQDIGNDDQNEVLILTGTGDRWFTAPGAEMFEDPWHTQDSAYIYQQMYDGLKNFETFLTAIEIPTIGAINGPGIHWEHAVLCDVTFATEDADLMDPHCLAGVPPGDGMGLVLQAILGPKRAAYYLYQSKSLPAAEALELGVINEIVPRDDLSERSWELAELILSRPRFGRRLTHSLTVRPWRKLLTEDFGYHLATEMVALLGSKDEAAVIPDDWAEAEGRKAW